MEGWKTFSTLYIALLITSWHRVHALSDKASSELDRAQGTGAALTDTIEAMTQSPTLSKLLSATRDKEKAKELISEAKTKVSAMASSTKAKLMDEDEGVAERVSGSVNGAMEGLVGMVNGIKNGDWVEGVQGALGIVSSFAALAGPGIGTLISGVLSAISTFLSLFGGSEAESEESMVKRVVEAAIKDLREKDMKEDVEGVQHLYQSMSLSIQQFREAKKLTTSQAEEFFTTAFQDVSVFGRLKTRIGELCDKPKIDDDAKKCVDFIKLYADLSILRQLILADMASLMTEPEIGLEGTADNILHVIRKEQENDLNLLQFLGDPGSNPGKRLVIATMFGYPENYEVLISYLHTLHKQFDEGIWKKDLVICTGRMLKNECVGISYAEQGEYKALDELFMNDKIQSFFVPLQGSVSFYDAKDFAGAKKGPYIGPALHGYSGSAIYSSLKYEKTDETNEGSVRYCESDALHPNSLCDYWPLKKEPEAVTEIALSGYHGFPWAKKIGSFYVPAKTVLYGFGEGDKKYGPFYGPQQVDKICGTSTKADWVKITLKRSKWDARKMVQVCELEDLKGSCFRTFNSLTDLTKIMGQCNFEKKVRSIKIPGGLEVTGYQSKEHKIRFAGPYRGPITIGRVDWSPLWASIKITGQAEEDINLEKEASTRSIEDPFRADSDELTDESLIRKSKLHRRHHSSRSRKPAKHATNINE